MIAAIVYHYPKPHCTVGPRCACGDVALVHAAVGEREAMPVCKRCLLVHVLRMGLPLYTEEGEQQVPYDRDR